MRAISSNRRSTECALRIEKMRRLLAVLLLGGALDACATNPVTGKREFNLLKEGQEIQIGRQMDVEIRRDHPDRFLKETT